MATVHDDTRRPEVNPWSVTFEELRAVRSWNFSHEWKDNVRLPWFDRDFRAHRLELWRAAMREVIDLLTEGLADGRADALADAVWNAHAVLAGPDGDLLSSPLEDID